MPTLKSFTRLYTTTAYFICILIAINFMFVGCSNDATSADPIEKKDPKTPPTIKSIFAIDDGVADFMENTM